MPKLPSCRRAWAPSQWAARKKPPELKRKYCRLLLVAFRRNAERDLKFFVRAAWPILEPTTKLEWNWHLDLLCECLTKVAQGECRRLIIDDPLSAKKAFSDQERDATNRNFDATFRSRLNNPATGAIIVVMQRLHDRDLTGHVLAQEPGAWTHIKLPAEAEEEERWEFA